MSTPTPPVTATAARAGWVATVLLGFVSLGFVAVFGRVAQLTMNPDGLIIERMALQHRERSLDAGRGGLVDRRGRPLAITHTGYRIFVDPYLIDDPLMFAPTVGGKLGLDPVAIDRMLSEREGSRYIVIDPDPPAYRVRSARELDINGLAVETYLKRTYPLASLGGQVIGFVGVDGDGLEGIERLFDDQLDSRQGHFRATVDARRRQLWVEPNAFEPQSDGQTVRLAMDSTIQAIAERQLVEAVERYHAGSGQMIVMDPWSGDLLAVAHAPLFDPNHVRQSTEEQRRLRVVTDIFEPGSILKPLIWASLTDAGAASPYEVIDCEDDGVYRSPRGRVLRDDKPHGSITWEQVLITSSNIGMAIVAQRVPIRDLHDAVTRLGFGQATGSGFPREAVGIVRPRHRWNHYSQTSIPMGHEIGVTGLQMVRAFATLANDGLLVRPRLVLDDTPVEQRRVLTPEMSRYVRTVLDRVVTEGTGRHARSDLYRIFGKTGTAQLPNLEQGGYYEHRYVSSFIAGAPTENPRLIVACFIHDPDRSIGHYGGTVAAPAVRNVIEQSLAYLGVPPRTNLRGSDDPRRVAGNLH
ncbi:peptidoglycan D,D-transpeptidase FtsI family protein [Mucisphaera calidilacus]|uniref:Peptidoglycan D,D-transpeptidase FtsI n=1 Tax=Mucisphaera calidilacus TaxID=2527982 RepID=A0A518BVI2_9BACT|nr:penicillin-binding protein 2 [Mucisphaera calidilacus]QDU70993.1 Peptidoglycan D,D-transpeptidase FtsI [Mucisphaera calidilacus]